MVDEEILRRIPQRDPFLFIEKICERGKKDITTSLKLTGREDFFRGHFPHRPIMPGVLTCESVFQTGALLMSYLMDAELLDQTAVISRIKNAKFKNMAHPGDELNIHVCLDELLDNTAFMKGKVTCQGKMILSIDFTCSLVKEA